MRRFLCLFLPYWPIERWRNRAAAPPEGPLVLTERGQGGIRLTAVDPAAAALGLAPGMSLADARALLPGLAAAPAEPERDARALAALVDWCARYSPWCAPDGEDGVRLDITGAAHLFGGEAEMLADLLRRLAGFGVTAQGAVAQSPAAGWGWARFRPAGAPAILACGSGAELAALPVAALRLDKESIETLIGLGLATVGDVAALPRGPLAHRLGEAALTRLDRMFGRAAEPISPQAPAEPWRAQIVFAEPIGRREDFDRAAEHLAGRLCRDLALKGQGARRLELAFYGVDGGVQRLGVGTSRPTHAPLHLLRLFAEKLETIDPGFGVEAIVLSAGETEPVAQTQAVLPDAAVVDAVDLAALIDRLQNRLGTARVLRLIPMESHAPERAERRESCGAPSRKAAEGETRRVGGGRVRGRDHRKTWTPPQKPVRPLRLLSLPEPIQAMAPIPDDPPLSFRWRRIVHRVAAADGPERIGPEWWTGAPGRVRDYYRVEDDDGRRFWLYREGLYGAAEPPRWFLHGFFA